MSIDDGPFFKQKSSGISGIGSGIIIFGILAILMLVIYYFLNSYSYDNKEISKEEQASREKEIARMEERLNRL